MGRASQQNREAMDKKRARYQHSDAGLQQTHQLFYHPFLAKKMHRLEPLCSTKKYRVSQAPKQPRGVCEETVTQAHYSLRRLCIIP